MPAFSNSFGYQNTLRGGWYVTPGETAVAEDLGPRLDDLDARIQALRAAIAAAIAGVPVEPSPATVNEFQWIRSQLDTNARRLLAVRAALQALPPSIDPAAHAVRVGLDSNLTSLEFRNNQLTEQAAGLTANLGYPDSAAAVASLDNSVVTLTDLISRLEIQVARATAVVLIPPGPTPIPVTPIVPAETSVLPWVIGGAVVIALGALLLTD